jgi:hypothetical protein
MATFNSTTFGAISGRHGSAVAATTKDGRSILKVFRAPGNPNTDKQQAQRTKFGFANSELSCMRNLFKTTFMSPNGMQQGVSLAMKNAVSGEAPDFVIDYSLLALSVGSVDSTGQVSVVKTTGTKVKLDWDTTIGTNSTEKDGINIVFFNSADKISVLKQNHAFRSVGTAEVELPEIWAGSEIHCWIYFSTPANSLNSASKYVGLVQL